MKSLTKSKARVRDIGEVFTPRHLVLEMLDKLPEDSWLPEKDFLEPACGTGNFIVEIVQKKIDTGSEPLQALATTHGVDIMPDNISECRQRLIDLVWHLLNDDEQLEAINIVNQNIRVGDTLTMSLEEIFKEVSYNENHEPIDSEEELSSEETIEEIEVAKPDVTQDHLVDRICTELGITFHLYEPQDKVNHVNPTVYGLFDGSETVAYLGTTSKGLSRLKVLACVNNSSHNKCLYTANFRLAHPESFFGWFETPWDPKTAEKKIRRYLGEQYGVTKGVGFKPVYAGRLSTTKDIMLDCNKVNCLPQDIADFCVAYRDTGDEVYRLKQMSPFLKNSLYSRLKQQFKGLLNMK